MINYNINNNDKKYDKTVFNFSGAIPCSLNIVPNIWEKRRCLSDPGVTHPFR